MIRAFCLTLVLCSSVFVAKQYAKRQILATEEQDPSDPTWLVALQLAIQSVKETYYVKPSFYYSPVERVYEVLSGSADDLVVYHIKYLTPNGWIFWGTDCTIDFVIAYDSPNPTWRDVSIENLVCINRTY